MMTLPIISKELRIIFFLSEKKALTAFQKKRSALRLIRAKGDKEKLRYSVAKNADDNFRERFACELETFCL